MLQTPEQNSIVELAEALKEMCRVIQCFPNYQKLPTQLKARVDGIYKKAIDAKDRVLKAGWKNEK